MITYFYDKKGVVTIIDYGVVELTEEEKQNPNKIQLEEEYTAEEKDGFYIELYVEDGTLKHRYKEIPKDEKDKKIENLQKEINLLKAAIFEIAAEEAGEESE